MADDYYNTLGVRRNASQEEIKQAYRDTVRRCHPDLHPEDKQARAKFQKVQTAFEVLSDPERRRAYHRSAVARDAARAGSCRPPGASKAEDPPQSLGRYAAVEVGEPVVGLALTTGLGMSLQYLALIDHLWRSKDPAAVGRSVEIPMMFPGGWGLFLGLVSGILGLVVIVGAVQMKHLEHYRFAVATAIIATLGCLSPWFLLGLPFGFWALLVLSNQQVRDAFWS